MNDQSMLIPSRVDRNGISEARTTLTPSSDRREKVILCDPRPCVPVIFLPGVMGTNLKSTGGASVWTPPNTTGLTDTIGAIRSLLGWAFRDAGTRQTRLNPNDTVVDSQGEIEVGSSGLSEDEARSRGWGEVHRSSYQGFLAYLQWQLNHPMLNGEAEGDWHESKIKDKHKGASGPDKAVMGTDPASFGASQKGQKLDENGLKHFSQYQYPVYAVGYNWTQSNGQSAEAVFARIKKICSRYGKGTTAIVVTHSMGGLVARALAKLVEGGEELIYGVVHGAQPATGAPMAAKRFRTGAEDFRGKAFFGSDDAEWTAVAASSQSALELMPMPDYRDGKPWWFICGADGKPILSLPRDESNAGVDIYTNRAWYGMLPEDKLIDPAGIVKSSAAVASGKKSLRGVFEESVKAAVTFQKSLANRYHGTTYALYGDGALSMPHVPTKKEQELMTFGTVTWKGSLPIGTTEKDLMAATLLHDDHQGTWRIQVRGQVMMLKIQGPDESGDGTVPATSAAAQCGREGVQQVFKQGGFDHQFCYQHPWAHWAALYAVAQISKLIPEPEHCHV